MNRIRDFLNTDRGFYVGAGIAALAVLLAIWAIAAQFGSSPARRSAQRIFIDANTNEQFSYTLSMGETIPVPSPHSGGARVGYDAEPCYWTAAGTIKQEPTWVLPRVKVDPQAEATFCPDCGRLVVPRNPVPAADSPPPPTREQYRPPRRRDEGDAPDTEAGRIPGGG